MLTAPGEDVGPLAALQARWRSLPPPADHQEPDGPPPCRRVDARSHRRLRPRVAMSFENLPARGIAAGSQPLVLWKDRQYADHRTTYPGNALQLDMAAYAQTDPLLLVPASEDARARYEDSFTRFCALFPDRFYVSERGRMFLTNARDIASDAEGHRLLSAGFHSQMGYFRDDRPLYDLVLDEAQQRQLDGLWKELDFITLAPVRQFKQFIWFERAEPPSFMATAQFNLFRSEDEDVTSQAKIAQLADAYLAKARAMTDDVALEVVRDYFDRMNGNVRALEAGEGGRRTQSSRRAARVRAAGLSPAADEAGVGRPARLLPLAARSASQSRRGDSRRGDQRADVAPLLLPRGPAFARENADELPLAQVSTARHSRRARHLTSSPSPTMHSRAA